MTEETTKLRVKLGGAEIEYEGGSGFLKQEIMPKVDKILGMVRDQVELAAPPAAPLIAANANETMVPEPIAVELDHSTNTIATLLDASAANDLAIAAAAKLTFADNKAKFTRIEILTEMKEAANFYKQSMSGNLTKALQALVKDGRLRQSADKTYALSHKERQGLEAKLADTH